MKAKQITTYHVKGEAKTWEKALAPEDESKSVKMIESNVINLYPDFAFQTIEGFGGAMTESSAYLASSPGFPHRGMPADILRRILPSFRNTPVSGCRRGFSAESLPEPAFPLHRKQQHHSLRSSVQFSTDTAETTGSSEH